MLRLISFFALFCLLFSSCSTYRNMNLPGTEASTLSSTKTSEPTITQEDLTDTPTNPILSPTITEHPTETMTFTKTPFLTTTPTPPGMALMKGVRSVNTSPQGNWLWGVDGYGYPEEGTELQYSKTFFTSKDGKAFWAVWPKTKDVGMIQYKQTYYEPIFWTADESSVYLGGSYCCSEGSFGYSGMNLARLNLTHGDFMILISGWEPHTFGFSQNGKYLMDTQYGVPRLRFIEIRTWKISDIMIDARYIYSWIAAFSPEDNLALVQSCDLIDLDCERYNILLVNIPKGSYRVLLSDVLQEMGMKINDFYAQSYDFSYSWVNDHQVSITARANGMKSYYLVLDIPDTD